MNYSLFLVKGHKMSSSGQIQDTVNSRTGPWSKWLSWKIQNGQSP